MESIDFRVAIAHKLPPKTRDEAAFKTCAMPAKNKPAKKNLKYLSPLECYTLARDHGHESDLEKQILKSDDTWVSYIYARNIKGANIRAHIQHIAKDNKISKNEQFVILEELSMLLNKSKEAQNG